MKPSHVNKLYSKLTPHEQAALVFEAVARRDEGEANSIMEQVERKHYLASHTDYSRRIQALTALVGQYGIEYWKNRALMLAACSLAENDNQQAEEYADRFFAKTVAIEHALIHACRLAQVDVSAVKTMASCPLDEAESFELPEVDAELVNQYEEMFDDLVG